MPSAAMSRPTAHRRPIRSYAPGFIFTTALPPAIAAAGNLDRYEGRLRPARPPAGAVAGPRRRCTPPACRSCSPETHIVPLLVGDAELCNTASDPSSNVHGIYIQPINYPTVPRGTERLRITPTPYHDDALIDRLAEALIEVWEHLGLPFKDRVPPNRPPSAFARQGAAGRCPTCRSSRRIRGVGFWQYSDRLQALDRRAEVGSDRG